MRRLDNIEIMEIEMIAPISCGIIIGALIGYAAGICVVILVHYILRKNRVFPYGDEND